MIGLHAVQIVASLVSAAAMVVGFILAMGSDFNPYDTAGLVRNLGGFVQGNLVYILGTAQFATVGFGLLAIRLRHRPHGVRRLGLHLPAAGHWLLVALLMPPLWLLCTALQAVMFQYLPGAQNEMAELMQSLADSPLGLLIMVIGAGPALGEELVFRGLIGRGLIARWGFVWGVIATSILFGVMHINPAQAISVIPLGIAMHYVYLTTRSFWAPVTFHLCNNSLSVVLLKHGDKIAGDGIAAVDKGLPLAQLMPIVIVASAMVLAISVLLWHTRVRYVLPDGSFWDPGFASSAAPPPELGALAVRQRPRQLLLLASAFNSLGFLAILWRLAAGV